MRLCLNLFHQGNKLFFDNFYTCTSVQLFKDLVLKHGIMACGTVRSNRQGFPKVLKDKRENRANRRDMRWVREDEVLTVQCKDNKCVTMMSPMHNATDNRLVNRRVKQNGKYQKIQVKQPAVIGSYNVNMSGVDKSVLNTTDHIKNQQMVENSILSSYKFLCFVSNLEIFISR